MQTPLDSFHAALVNLQRRREAEGTSRRRRRIGVTTPRPGMRVVFRIPANLVDVSPWRGVRHLDGHSGVIDTVSQQTADVRFDNNIGLVLVPLLALDMEDPPPDGTNIEEIEAWLAS